MNPLTALPAWQALQAHASELAPTHLRQLFEADPGRFARFSLEVDGLLFDYSKQRIVPDTLPRLFDLARARDVEGWRARMFGGEAINHTEGRAVLHTALRAPGPEPILAAGKDVLPEVHDVLRRMGAFCERVRSGQWLGMNGSPVRHIVNIGIGGSDLGPKMAVQALQAHGHPELEFHFVSNVDGAHIAATLKRCDPARTLFIVASKTFTTQETLANAQTARTWVLAAARAAGHDEAMLARHFVAVSTNLAATGQFGIDPANVFGFWDWVGGRYSMWSAVGLPVMLALGAEGFGALLAGAHAMDEHFRTAPLEANMPVLMALLGIWNTDFLGAASLAVLPYSQSLSLLPAYLQQLEMESNGKAIDRDGAPVGAPTCPVLWGEAGTNGQHSFHQLLHQGGALIPCDFIASARPDFPVPGHHDKLLANCLAQSAAMMKGKTADEARAEMQAAGLDAATLALLLPHKVFPGNQPSSTLLLPRLDPRQLGRLVALYEHKVFVQGVIWGLNPFDQWGVEYGKQLAAGLLPLLERGTADGAGDCSTAGLLARIHKMRQGH